MRWYVIAYFFLLIVGVLMVGRNQKNKFNRKEPPKCRS